MTTAKRVIQPKDRPPENLDDFQELLKLTVCSVNSDYYQTLFETMLRYCNVLMQAMRGGRTVVGDPFNELSNNPEIPDYCVEVICGSASIPMLGGVDVSKVSMFVQLAQPEEDRVAHIYPCLDGTSRMLLMMVENAQVMHQPPGHSPMMLCGNGRIQSVSVMSPGCEPMTAAYITSFFLYGDAEPGKALCNTLMN